MASTVRSRRAPSWPGGKPQGCAPSGSSFPVVTRVLRDRGGWSRTEATALSGLLAMCAVKSRKPSAEVPELSVDRLGRLIGAGGAVEVGPARRPRASSRGAAGRDGPGECFRRAPADRFDEPAHLFAAAPVGLMAGSDHPLTEAQCFDLDVDVGVEQDGGVVPAARRGGRDVLAASVVERRLRAVTAAVGHAVSARRTTVSGDGTVTVSGGNRDAGTTGRIQHRAR